MERNLAYLLPENLYRVFNETGLDKRKGAIADLWGEDGIFIASIKDPKRSAPLSRLCSASFRVPSLRLPPRFRKTSLDAFPGSMDRSAEPPSPKAST